jgi:hypothetical protein
MINCHSTAILGFCTYQEVNLRSALESSSISAQFLYGSEFSDTHRSSHTTCSILSHHMHRWSTAQSPFSVAHAFDGPLVFLFSSKSNTVWVCSSPAKILFIACSWGDTLILPAIVAAASVVFLVIHLFWASAWGRKLRAFVFRTSEQEITEPGPVIQPVGLVARVKEHVAQHGGITIFTFKLVRLVACLALLGLSITSLALTEARQSGAGEANIFGKW